jgi:hypothetical protein
MPKSFPTLRDRAPRELFDVDRLTLARRALLARRVAVVVRRFEVALDFVFVFAFAADLPRFFAAIRNPFACKLALRRSGGCA